MATNLWSDSGFAYAGMTPNSGQVFPLTVANNLTAAGSTAAGALALTSQINIIGTAAASTGVRLPDFPIGTAIEIANHGSNAVLPYPATGGIINAGTVDQAGGTIAATTGYAEFVVVASKTYQRMT